MRYEVCNEVPVRRGEHESSNRACPARLAALHNALCCFESSNSAAPCSTRPLTQSRASSRTRGVVQSRAMTCTHCKQTCYSQLYGLEFGSATKNAFFSGRQKYHLTFEQREARCTIGLDKISILVALRVWNHAGAPGKNQLLHGF